MEYFQSDLFNKNNEREKGHRAWEAEHRWTVRGNLDYIYPYSKTGRIEGGYQYFSYLEDGDYTMHFWDPVKKEFYNRDDIYNTFYFQHGIQFGLCKSLPTSYKSFDFQAGIRGEHTHRACGARFRARTVHIISLSFSPLSIWAIRFRKSINFWFPTHAVLPAPSFSIWSRISPIGIFIRPRSVTRISVRNISILSS